MKNCDILIIGAGPAGCLAALGAYKKNPKLNILVVEKDKEPRHKIGEALLTGTISVFEEAGILENIKKASFHPKIGAAYLWGKNKIKPWYVNYPLTESYPVDFIKKIDGNESRTAIHVERTIFEKVLRESIVDKVTFVFDKIDSLSKEEDEIKSVTLKNGGKIFPKYVIDASGPSGVVGNFFNERFQIGNKRSAKYAYFKIKDWSKAKKEGFHPNRTNILYHDNGWMWVIPFGDKREDLVSVGFVGEKEFIKSINSIQDLKNKFSNIFSIFNFEECIYDNKGKKIKDFYKRYNFSYISKKLNGKNWALAGDAALFIDPILSQGVTLASYYGFKRGQDAVDFLNGNNISQIKTSREYFAEALILIRVCKMWYDSENFVNDWHVETQNLSKEIYNKKMSLEDSFRYITNLENLMDRYNPYPKDVWEEIEKHLN